MIVIVPTILIVSMQMSVKGVCWKTYEICGVAGANKYFWRAGYGNRYLRLVERSKKPIPGAPLSAPLMMALISYYVYSLYIYIY